MVIRGYLTGHAWREYRDGKRMLCGVPMPDGMIENQKFEQPLITPTTKAEVGHDEDISREEILSQGLVSEEDYILLEKYTRELFQRGTELAKDKGLFLSILNMSSVKMLMVKLLLSMKFTLQIHHVTFTSKDTKKILKQENHKSNCLKSLLDNGS